MARPKGRSASAPRYGHHKASGNAVVRIGGKDHYLGKHGTTESKEKYHRLITELWNPEIKPVKPLASKVGPGDLTITLLAVEYVKFAKTYYVKNGKPTSELKVLRTVLKKLRSIYGSLPATEFGPLRFQAFRQTFIDDGLARSTINHYCWHVQKMFQLAGKNELVPMSLYRDLKAVGNLMEGRSKARETDDVLPVDKFIFDATLEELTPTVAAMAKVQILTGMRPGEVCHLRPCDVDRSSDVWVYRPPTHKNEHKKNQAAKVRVIMIGPKAQQVLSPYLLRDHQAFCFSPGEAYEQHLQRRRGNRKTPANAGNKPRSRKPKNFQPRYNKDSYRNAVQRAALRAYPYPKVIKGNPAKEAEWHEVYQWSPNQLRHNTGTAARAVAGLETAQQICGHTQIRTTERYAEINADHAVAYALIHG